MGLNYESSDWNSVSVLPVLIDDDTGHLREPEIIRGILIENMGYSMTNSSSYNFALYASKSMQTVSLDLSLEYESEKTSMSDQTAQCQEAGISRTTSILGHFKARVIYCLMSGCHLDSREIEVMRLLLLPA